MTRWNFNNLLAFADSHIVDYPTPITLNYNWSFGSAAGICLAIQILSGIFLSIHYTPHIDYAFSSVEHIMRDVKYGWFLRYLHANGASFFFIVVYYHIFRGLYHGSYAYPRQALWCSGVVIFILIIATAFLGYVLPWGQISFWGATVITNLFSVIPLIGKKIVIWLWGGYTVKNPTLNRFFVFHYVLPFVITGIVFVHLGLLHKDGSNNPLGIKSENLSFYPYFYVKDLLVFFIFLASLGIFLCFWPNTIGHTTNYIPANPIKTPNHVAPEWYFLPFYAILRSIPNKVGGIVAIGGALLVLFLLPFIHTGNTRSATFRPLYRIGFWLWIGTFILLTWVAQIPPKDHYIPLGQVLTLLYFVFLIGNVTLVGSLENFLAQRQVPKENAK